MKEALKVSGALTTREMAPLSLTSPKIMTMKTLPFPLVHASWVPSTLQARERTLDGISEDRAEASACLLLPSRSSPTPW